MKYVSYLILGACFAPNFLSAKDLELSLPIDCDLGQTCYIQQYVDHDPSSSSSDYRCSTLTYDAHKGTDFALNSTSQLDEGVAVLASADGTVAAFRDGIDDILYTNERAADVAGKECGNGVVINHPGGWQTQYCHLKKGSISVVKGQKVKAGDMLGHVGLSGKTQFPHVHLSVRQGKLVIDPFSPKGRLTCDPKPEDTLWKDLPTYEPGGLVKAGFYDAAPDFEDVKAGSVTSDHMTVSSKALVLYVQAFGTKTGDIIKFKIDGPKGVIHEAQSELTRNQAMVMRASGRKAKRRYWNAGEYSGTIELIRQGNVIETMHTTITLK